jgi:hypothetical protein
VTAIIGRDVVANLTSGMSPRTGTDKVGSGVTGFRTKGKQNKGQQMFRMQCKIETLFVLQVKMYSN